MNRFLEQLEADFAGAEELEQLEELAFYEDAKSSCITEAFARGEELEAWEIIEALEHAELAWTEMHSRH